MAEDEIKTKGKDARTSMPRETITKIVAEAIRKNPIVFKRLSEI